MTQTAVNQMPPAAKVVSVATVTILVVQALVAGAVLWAWPSLEKAAQFGDTFGVVNALFSGLAFSGLIYTALLQRSELSLQRKELELTRLELARTAKAQEQAEVALRAQADSARQSAHLNAINFLLAHYQAERQRLSGAYSAGSHEDHRRQELNRREGVLSAMLDALFQELAKKKE